MKSSTRSFIKKARQIPGFSLFDFIHGYIYGRWPYFYIGMAVNPPRALRPLARFADWLIRRREVSRHADGDGHSPASPTIADTYHGKVIPLDEAARLVRVNEDVSLTVPEHVIPFAVARDIVMEHPDHIVVLDCPCRMARENPCLPLDVCLIVGEPFASFILDHQPDHARRITPDEAVGILEAEDRRGHVHHAFFKDAMLQRFYAICNCCSCCCGAMQAHRNGVPMLISSGYVSQVDEERCVGCGACVEKCQFGALALQDGHVVVDAAACMGCGVCVNTCPQEALSLARLAERPAPLEIQELMAQVVTA
ncbi:MAG: 4Fe-4S binding protein [Anaerolineae bacterium]|nr:4Fe-4S binding protein [Anaerolineae bacterium]